MRVVELRFHTLAIPFKEQFSHASASRSTTSSVWVEAVTASGIVGVGEACPRSYVTGETLDSARDFFRSIRTPALEIINDAVSLRAFVSENDTFIDQHPAAWCAIELALIDALSREAGLSAQAWLGLNGSGEHFQYSAVLGDADTKTFAATFERYRTAGLSDFKLKLSGDLTRDRAKLAILDGAGSAVARLRLDANNLWTEAEAAITWLGELAAPAFAIEEPLKVARATELPRIARELGLAIILDESLTRIGQLDMLDQDTPWIVNLRVSKLGGLLRTLALVEAARQRGIGIVIGAQVGETSLLTRVGLIATQAAGDMLIAQEGAFGTLLLMDDVCEPSLMFGAHGRLHHVSVGAGWGLDCKPRPEWLGS